MLLENSLDPDQMPHDVASDLGLHCLPMTLLCVSRLAWVKICILEIMSCYVYFTEQRCLTWTMQVSWRKLLKHQMAGHRDTHELQGR